MKKKHLLPIMGLIVSCSSKPNYTKMVETTYNFNSSAVNLIIESDTTAGDFIEVDKDGSIFVFENNSDFILKASKNPNQLEIVESKGNGSKWVEERGFEITSKKSGDTLIVHFFPTENTPAGIIKFGTEYKFFN